jgi:hypothetical protein
MNIGQNRHTGLVANLFEDTQSLGFARAAKRSQCRSVGFVVGGFEYYGNTAAIAEPGKAVGNLDAHTAGFDDTGTGNEEELSGIGKWQTEW